MQNQRNQGDHLFSSPKGFKPGNCTKGSSCFSLSGQDQAEHTQHSHGDQEKAQAKSKWDFNSDSWEMGLEGSSKAKDGKFTCCIINVQEVKKTLPPFPLITSCLSLSRVGNVFWHQQNFLAHLERPQLLSTSMHILEALVKSSQDRSLLP